MGKAISDQDKKNLMSKVKGLTLSDQDMANFAAKFKTNIMSAAKAGASIKAIKAAINAAKNAAKPLHRGTGPQAKRMGGKVVKKRMYGGSVKKRK